MSLSRFITILISLVVFNTSVASIHQYEKHLPEGTNLSLLVQQVGTKKTVIDYNSQQVMLPASTQKVVTALAAILELGADYRFSTTFETHGQIQSGVLNGNLIARFTGDPSLTRNQLKSMVSALKNQGVNRINGALYIDTSIFSSHDQPSGWSWDNMTQCYSAPPGAAIIDQNCFFISLDATKRNAVARGQVLNGAPIGLSSYVKAYASKAPEARFCEFDIKAHDNNRFDLTGCIVQQQKPIVLSFAISDTAYFAAQTVLQELNRAGISTNGKIQYAATGQGKILAQNFSAPLSTLLTTMLKRSDNITADSLFRVLGQRVTNTPGTWRNGEYAVKYILNKRAGIQFKNAILADGSGLSRHNLISAKTMMEILQYIADNNSQLHLIEMLPIAAKDGTLIGRKSLRDAGLDGVVKAKTGALSGVYNLAGFIQKPNGQYIAFVQFISGYVPQNGNKRSALNEFEKNLYQDIYLDKVR